VPKVKTGSNPFYPVLVGVGALFVVTAFAYFTMTIREMSPSGAASSGFMTLLARHGLTALIVELILLAIATIGAIATDDYWSRKTAVAHAARVHPDDAPETRAPQTHEPKPED
jgi:hypothetical protein